MALYIKPPTGLVGFNKLYCFVMKRLAFLYYIKNHSVEDVTHIIEQEALANTSDCLIEGTVKDKISHFTLRLLCTSDFTLEEFFIQNETKLFNYRLQFCDITRIRQMLQKASKHSKHVLFSKNYVIKSYEKVLKSLIFISEQLEYVISKGGKILEVPFTSGLKFVKDRVYPLHLGFIKLPLTELKSLLMCLFKELIVEGMNQTRKSTCLKELNDPRMQYIYQKIKKWLHLKLNPIKGQPKNILNVYNLMNDSKKFPLCMHNLHTLLLKNHRLKHVSRIQYTLFLKEIGVPCTDTIKLFMREYSIPIDQNHQTHKGGHSNCAHNWADSKNRYIYGIEHLYGKRGACKNYKAHNCQSLQNSYDSEGGCPFVSFDDQHLEHALKSQNLEVNDIEDIISMVHKKKYQNACSSYLLCKINSYCNEGKKYKCLNNSETQKNINMSFINSSTSNNNSILNQEKVSVPTVSLNISSPFDFYSILSSYVDE